MKHYFTLITIFTTVFSINAGNRQVADVDTIIINRNNKSQTTVIYYDEDGNIKITDIDSFMNNNKGNDTVNNEILAENIEFSNSGWKSENDFNIDFPFKRTKALAHFSISAVSGIMLGFVGSSISPAVLPVNMGRSFEIFAPSLLSLQYKTTQTGPEFSIGFGLGWKNYHSKNSYLLKPDDDNNVLMTSFPESSCKRSSHIHAFSLMFPFFIKQKLSKNIQTMAGAILDINTHMCAKTKYTLDNIKYKNTWDVVNKRPVTYDLILVISYSNFGWYVKYSPMNIFRYGTGPTTKSISTGLAIGF